MSEFFKQCRLVIPGNGPVKCPIAVQTAWIPERFAHVGKVLSLLRSDGSWSEGWVVNEVYNRLSEEYVREHEQDYKSQRKASDV